MWKIKSLSNLALIYSIGQVRQALGLRPVRQLGAALVLACFAAAPAQARIYDDVVASGYIRIGLYRDFPPYSFIDSGVARGVDVEIGERIAKALKVRFVPHWITPDETVEDDLRNNVWRGRILDKDTAHPLALKDLADVMLRVPYDRDYSNKRDSTGELASGPVVMFGPYQRERWQVAYNSDRIPQLDTLALFQYHPIGVEVDSVPAFYLTSALQGRMRSHTHHYLSTAAAFAAMQRGEVDAVMGMRAQIDWLVHKAGDARFKLGDNGFPTMGKQVWDLGMAVKENSRQLAYAVEDIVDGMIRSGEMKRLYASYGLQYELPGLLQDTSQTADAAQ